MSRYTIASTGSKIVEAKGLLSTGERNRSEAPDGLRHAVEADSPVTLCALPTAELHVFDWDFHGVNGAKPRCPVCAERAGV